MNQTICFYFPYYEDSGVPVLFYRMANAIALAYPDTKVSVIDFENGAMWRNLVDLPNIEKIKFEYNTIVSPPAESVLVMQTFVPYYWPRELVLKQNQKLFFWNLHPHNLIPSLLPFPLLRKLPMNYFFIYQIVSRFYPKLLNRLRDFTETLIAHQGLYFMDKSNLDFTEKYLFLNIKERKFLPVPADPAAIDINEIANRKLGNTVKFAWIGRLCDFKSYILAYAFEKVNAISSGFPDKKFEFHIVGNGPFEEYLKNRANKCEAISFFFHGAIPHQEIDQFILDKADILMAMGTSALEGAKFGKPTILLDPVLSEPRGDYFFRMLYDTQEFDLGHFINKTDYKKDNTSLYDLVSSILTNYSSQSLKTYKYFFENHNIDNLKHTFLRKVSRSVLRYSMLDPHIFKKPLLLKIYNRIRNLNE